METRRKFLKKMAAAGASALVVPQLLASCGKEEETYEGAAGAANLIVPKGDAMRITGTFLDAILHSVFCRVRTMRFNAESFVAVIVRDKLLCTCVKCKIHFCILRKFTFSFVVFYQRNKVVLSIAPNHCGT